MGDEMETQQLGRGGIRYAEVRRIVFYWILAAAVVAPLTQPGAAPQSAPPSVITTNRFQWRFHSCQ